jgi:hypothetical protein
LSPITLPYVNLGIAPVVKYAKLMIAIAAEAAPTNNRYPPDPVGAASAAIILSIFNHRSKNELIVHAEPFNSLM